LALKAAQRIAALQAPAGTATALSRTSGAADWPSNVETVSMAASTRSQASPYLDGSGGWDDREVVIVTMRGDFEIAVNPFGPNSPTSFKAVETRLVVDAVTGETLDSIAIAPGSTPPDVPGLVPQYSSTGATAS
jgi:hypothetical protein